MWMTLNCAPKLLVDMTFDSSGKRRRWGKTRRATLRLWAAFHATPRGRKPGTIRSEGEKHTLAVLPVENLCGDSDREYFVDGPTEELRSSEDIKATDRAERQP